MKIRSSDGIKSKNMKIYYLYMCALYIVATDDIVTVIKAPGSFLTNHAITDPFWVPTLCTTVEKFLYELKSVFINRLTESNGEPVDFLRL